MKVCVLQVSYEGSVFEYRHDDMARDLSGLLPGHTVHHEFLRKADAYKQIRDLSRRGFDIYVNLCEGYPETDVCSVDVLWALEHFNLAYTGPEAYLYCPAKDVMKLVAHGEGVDYPAFAVVGSADDLPRAVAHLNFPVFVKPNCMGDSLGIDARSLAATPEDLKAKVAEAVEEYGPAIVEEFVEGRELTVLVCGRPDPALPPMAFLPLEFRFPQGERFKTYDLKIRQVHPEANVPCTEPVLAGRLKDAARKIFTGFSGVGYARMDFRLSPQGRLFFLDANFGCSIFYPEGYEGSADYILRYDGLGQAGFLEKIIAEGLARHARKQKPYVVGRSTTGYGVFARHGIPAGSVVFRGEETPRRLVTREYVEANWSPEDKEFFHRYAYPIGSGVYAIWDRDPAGWAPQNHSCDPNTAFRGLDVVALCDIPAGEELTIDYATFCGPDMTPFDCECRATGCRGKICVPPQET